jgi:hypothetical protein
MPFNQRREYEVAYERLRRRVDEATALCVKCSEDEAPVGTHFQSEGCEHGTKLSRAASASLRGRTPLTDTKALSHRE